MADEERIIEAAYFSSSFSYFLQNIENDVTFLGAITRLVFCDSKKIYFLLIEGTNFVHIMDKDFKFFRDVYVEINGIKSAHTVLDFQYDSESQIVK